MDPEYLKNTPNHALQGRRESLDALRGLAAVLIYVFHFFALYPPGAVAELGALNHLVLNYFAVGVPLFYALSGVSLYIGYFGKHANPGFVRDFYLRRLFRILPLFYTAALVWFLIFYSRSATPPFKQVASTLSFLFNLMPGRHESLVAAGWSVGVEMLFYAVFPIIVARAVSIRSSLVLLVAAAVVAVYSFRYLTTAYPGSSYPGLSVFAHGQFFAGGIAVFFLADRWLHKRPQFGKAGGLMPALAFCGVFVSISVLVSGWFGGTPPGRDPSVARVLWVVPIMFLLFSACTVRPYQPWLAPFAKLGEWSFSLYLLHPLVLYFLFEPQRKHPVAGPPTPQAFFLYLGVGLIALVACSAVTYRWIEKPGIDLGRRIASRVKPSGVRS